MRSTGPLRERATHDCWVTSGPLGSIEDRTQASDQVVTSPSFIPFLPRSVRFTPLQREHRYPLCPKGFQEIPR